MTKNQIKNVLVESKLPFQNVDAVVNLIFEKIIQPLNDKLFVEKSHSSTLMEELNKYKYKER